MKQLIILTALLSAALAVNGQSKGLLQYGKLSNRQSILNGKAYFMFPAAAVNTPRVADIMSADYNVNKETRIILDIGSMRLVFYAQELYTIADTGFVRQTLKDNDEIFDFKKRVLKNKDSIITVLSTPSKYDSTKGGILINSLLVKTPDNTLFQIDAYINPEAYSFKAAYQQLTEDVFASCTKGQRRIDLRPRQQAFPIMGGDKTFIIDLPAGYQATRDAKYDFEVLHLRKYLQMGAPGTSALTIYTGHHPSYFAPSYNLSEESAGHVAGNFAGTAVDWLMYEDRGNHLWLKEQKIPIDTVAPDLVAHIAMVGNSSADIAEMTAVVEGIKLGSK